MDKEYNKHILDDDYNYISDYIVRSFLCDYFKLSESDIFTRDRRAKVIFLRHLYFYICHHLLNISASWLSRLTGFNHATIMHSAQVIDDYIFTEPAVRNQVKDIKYKLGLI